MLNSPEVTLWVGMHNYISWSDWRAVCWRWRGCVSAPIFSLLVDVFTTKLAKSTMSYLATVYFEDYALRTGVVESQLLSGQAHVAILSVRLPHLCSHSMMLNIGITILVAYIRCILLLVSGCRLILYVKHCGESIGSMMNIIYGLCRKLIFYRMDSAYLLVMIEKIWWEAGWLIHRLCLKMSTQS